MEEYKIFWHDVETTGLYKDENDIHQLALLIEINGEIVEEADIKMKPTRTENIDQEALKICNVTEEQIMSYPEAKIGYCQIQAILDKHINKYNKRDKAFVGGYNVPFDYEFFNDFGKRIGQSKYGWGSYLNHCKVDPLQFVGTLQIKGLLPILANRKLGTFCEHFGIEIKAHDALSDIKATRELYLKFLELMKLT